MDANDIYNRASFAMGVVAFALAVYLEFKKNNKGALVCGGVAILIFVLTLMSPGSSTVNHDPLPMAQNSKVKKDAVSHPSEPAVAPDKQTHPDPPKEKPQPERLTLTLPQGVEIDWQPRIEITYMNVPLGQYLWLLVYGEEGTSKEHIYWPIGHIDEKGGVTSIIHNIDHEQGSSLHSWSSEGLEQEVPWFMDLGNYRLELIAVDEADDKYLKGVVEHEFVTGKWDGIDERGHKLRLLLHAQTIHVRRNR